MINGVINVYKEKGYTSHDVVAVLRGVLKQKKIGHTGTLDPDATGVLPVCLGSATKLCDMLTDKNKEYVAEFLLGKTTDTQDITGEVVTECEVNVSSEQVKNAVYSFLGKSEQIPPMYSALKVNGKKLYELAREGKEIERKARPIEILDLEILEIDLPKVKIRVSCTKGTYIRTLCYDIGQKLLCGAVMTSLVRTKVERFEIAQAKTIADIEGLQKEGLLDDYIVPVDTVFCKYQELIVKNEFQKMIDNGNAVYPNQIKNEEVWNQAVQLFLEKIEMDQNEEEKLYARVYNENGNFYGIYYYHLEQERFVPFKMFLEK